MMQDSCSSSKDICPGDAENFPMNEDPITSGRECKKDSPALCKNRAGFELDIVEAKSISKQRSNMSRP